MNSTLNLHSSGYNLSTGNLLASASTCSCLPLGIRHHEMAEQTAPNNWAHHCLSILHSIPVIGLFTGLADCTRKWKKNQVRPSHNNITDVASAQFNQQAPQSQQMSFYPQSTRPQENNYLGFNENQSREMFSEAMKTPPSNQRSTDFHDIIPIFIAPRAADVNPHVDEVEHEQNNVAAESMKGTKINKHFADLMNRKFEEAIQKRSIAMIGRSYVSSSRANQQSTENAKTA